MKFTRKITALEAFNSLKGEIEELLARLQEITEDNFDVSPDDVTWGHVGVLAEYAAQLSVITEWE